MVGSLDIAPDGSCLFISFPYREDLVELVRNIPGRRWDRMSKVWKVPIEHCETAVMIFMAHGFSISPEVSMALASGGKDTGERKIKLGEVKDTVNALTISQLNLRVAEVLRQSFAEPMWIVGEVQNFNKRGRSRHKYFELVEKVEDELGEEQLRASVSCVIWENQMALIRTRLQQSGSNLTLEDGLQVRMRGKVELYQARGQYQLILEDIDPKYTLGEIVLKREKILQDLRRDGLADRNRELPLPLVPLRVALVTAETGDALQDFAKTLKQSRFGFDVMLYPVRVQGEKLRPTVLAALAFFADRADDFDVLVICRGGGSRSELGWWDDGEVARAVATHPLKTVIGIGHERDQCVLDLLAESVKTPTAAAELLVDRVRDYQQRVEDCMLEIGKVVEARLREERHQLRHRALRLHSDLRAVLVGARHDLAAASTRLRVGVQRRLDRGAYALGKAGTRLGFGATRALERAAGRLETQELRSRALDPARVLARGFAVLRGRDGRALRSVRGVAVGQELEARLADGALDLRVEARREQAGREGREPEANKRGRSGA
ncbi:MAG: exodeoxyribonuclease VII large subunit [Planctomycetota bacterium]